MTDSTQTAIITGANSGLGLHCARLLLADDPSWHVVLAVRDRARGEAAAQRLGAGKRCTVKQLDLASLQFNKSVETANGVGLGAPYMAGRFTVGSIELTNVPMSVNKAPMSSSLLGMAFFNRLQSFRFEGDKLYLKPKG